MSKLPKYMPGLESQTIFNSNLNKYLQDNVGQDGFVIPSRSTTDITGLSAQKPNGTMWYDETDEQLKVMKNGTVRTVTTS